MCTMAANELSSDFAMNKLTETVGKAKAELAKHGKPKAALSEDTFDFNIDTKELKRCAPSSLIVTEKGTVHAVASTGAVRVARDTGDVRGAAVSQWSAGGGGGGGGGAMVKSSRGCDEFCSQVQRCLQRAEHGVEHFGHPGSRIFARPRASPLRALAVRILHARHCDGDVLAPTRDARRDGRTRGGASRRQPVPLHRLPANPRCGQVALHRRAALRGFRRVQGRRRWRVQGRRWRMRRCGGGVLDKREQGGGGAVRHAVRDSDHTKWYETATPTERQETMRASRTDGPRISSRAARPLRNRVT